MASFRDHVGPVAGPSMGPSRRSSYRREKRLTFRSISTYSSDSETDDEYDNKEAANAQNAMANGRTWTAKKVLLVATCTSSMILNISCQNSASVSLPQIGREFNVTEAELQWIVSGYSLSSGCLLIFVGRLADLHGRKLAFLLGVAWLLVFSIACGFAKDIVSLNILRALQGLGAAAFVPASLGILAHAFPISRARSIAFATFSAGAPIGGGLGMQMGGVLTQLAKDTWRATFFLSAAIAALIVILGFFVIEKDTPSTEEDRRVDWLGAILVTASLTLIQFALGQGPIAPKRWGTSYIVVSIFLGLLLLGLFLGWQYHLERPSSQKSRSPLMKLSMWKRAKGKFAVMQCIAFLEYAAFMSWLFWSQLYYQNYAGFSPIQCAIRFLPMPITGILCSILVAFIIGSVDVLFLVVCGTLMTGIAGLLFAVIDPSASYWAFGFPSAIVAVFGADFVFPSGTLFVAKVSLPHEQSLAGGLFQTLTQLGTALGLAVTTIIHDATLRIEAPNISSESNELHSKPALQSYRAAQWGVVVIAVIACILALTFLRGVGPVGHRKTVDKLTESFAEGFQPQPDDASSSFSAGKSSSVFVPSLEITRCKNNPLDDTSSKKNLSEALYVVWRHPESKKDHEEGEKRDSTYFFVA